MRHWTGPEAVEHVLAAATAADIFDECGGERRRIGRLYRVLAFAIHPDRATQESIDPADAERATLHLNELYEQVREGAPGTPGAKPAAAKPKAAPHVVGKHSTYLFGDKLHESRGVATYATDRERVRIEIAKDEKHNAKPHAVVAVAQKLADAGLAGYAPTVLDHGVTAGRAWVAYELPDGLYTLRQVRARYDQGLDGRDWAWMARRLYMVLDAAGTPHGALNLDNVHVHPEGHGIVLTGWAGDTKDDALGVAALFNDMLCRGVAEFRQCKFTYAAHLDDLAPAKALAEYDLLLRRLYGERRFRPFSMT